MSKKEKLTLVAVVVIGLSLILFSRANSNSEDNRVSQAIDYEAVARQSDEGRNFPDNYIDYYDGVIEATEGQKILYFHSPWCTTCVELENDIEANGLPEDFTLIRTPFYDELELRKKYGVTLQTYTVLIDDAGNELNAFYAGVDPTVAGVVEGLGL